MSASLSRIKAFANRALAKQPSDWEIATYPVGKHIWTDIYSEQKVTEIGKIISYANADQLRALRLLLAYAAADAVKSLGMIGGPASDGKKRSWANRVVKDAKRLRNTLQKGKGHASGRVDLKYQDGKNIGRLIPGSYVDATIWQVIASIDELVNLVEPPAHFGVNTTSGEEDRPTSHAIYLQEAVDRMTDVFVQIEGLEAVTRITDEGGVRGKFADFVRAATVPLLQAYYPGSTRRTSKLDAQIQDAVARYRRRRMNKTI